LLTSLVLSLVLGAGLTMILYGRGVLMLGPRGEVASTDTAVDTVELLLTPGAASPTPLSATVGDEASPSASPASMPLDAGEEKGEDLEDVLLLYDSTHVTSFDINFCKIAEYYGLLCRRIALDAMDLTDGLLRDARGDHFKLVGISAGTLLQSPPLITDDELGIVQSAIETGGVNLLVSNVTGGLDPTRLAELTAGEALGAVKPVGPIIECSVSSAAPEITREFTGQVVRTGTRQGDFALILGRQGSVTTLIASTDHAGVAYPLFVRWKNGTGYIFILGGEQGESLEELPLREMYYDAHNFTKIVPLMLTMRYAFGEEVWHGGRDYANLTIDDPALTEPFRNLSFLELLRQMNAHNFHTTIAFVPANWDRSESMVVRLFRSHADRYSLVQHGNNHDGYEFYKYSVSDEEEYGGRKLPANPLADQEADIVEGLARMEQHRHFTAIDHDRVMVFPWGISPEPTLALLKKYNFLATVNAQDIPLNATRPADWDHGMYQANMDYGNFPTLSRRPPGTYPPFQPRLQSFIFDLFIDKPALFYADTGLFETADAFNVVADQINGLTGEVEWRSLGDIIRHLCLEKRNDDGSVDVKMYANHLIVTNPSSDERTYHISKAETLSVSISVLTVNGREFPYRVDDGLLTLDVRVPANTSAEILIYYGE
jgi:hypothetical protein